MPPKSPKKNFFLSQKSPKKSQKSPKQVPKKSQKVIKNPKKSQKSPQTDYFADLLWNNSINVWTRFIIWIFKQFYSIYCLIILSF